MNLPALSTYYADERDELLDKIKWSEAHLEEVLSQASSAMDFAVCNGAGDLIDELSSLLDSIQAKEAIKKQDTSRVGISEAEAKAFSSTDYLEADPISVKAGRASKELKRLFSKLSHKLHPDKSTVDNCAHMMSEAIRMYKLRDLVGLKQLYESLTNTELLTSDKLVRDHIEQCRRRLDLLSKEIENAMHSPGYMMHSVIATSVNTKTAVSKIRQILNSAISGLRSLHFPENTRYTYSIYRAYGTSSTSTFRPYSF